MKVLTFDYNRAFSPPAPFVDVEVNNYDADGEPLLLTAQLDSGADASMMPVAILEQVGARFEATQFAHDFSGQTHMVDLYSAAITLAGRTFYLRVIAQEDSSEGIIGRDVLNHMVVTLNGPAASTEIPVEVV